MQSASILLLAGVAAAWNWQPPAPAPPPGCSPTSSFTKQCGGGQSATAYCSSYIWDTTTLTVTVPTSTVITVTVPSTVVTTTGTTSTVTSTIYSSTCLAAPTTGSKKARQWGGGWGNQGWNNQGWGNQGGQGWGNQGNQGGQGWGNQGGQGGQGWGNQGSWGWSRQGGWGWGNKEPCPTYGGPKPTGWTPPQISSICTCLGVSSITLTTTSTATATSTITTPVTSVVTTTGVPVTVTITTTSGIPPTNTYVATNGDTYLDYVGQDIYGYDSYNGPCFNGSTIGIGTDKGVYQCQSFNDCQNVCSQLRAAGSMFNGQPSCVGVTYSAGDQAHCYLKYAVPGNGLPWCPAPGSTHGQSTPECAILYKTGS